MTAGCYYYNYHKSKQTCRLKFGMGEREEKEDLNENLRFGHKNSPIVVDCEQKLSAWSSCSATCGTGTKTRYQIALTKHPQHGGEPCQEYQAETCDEGPCPCSYQWSEWSRCSVDCGGGTRERHSYYGENTCQGYQTDKCNSEPCPCVYQWSQWSACSVDCGGGTRERHSNYGEAKCHVSVTETCNTGPCPVHCAFQWSDWGECSQHCGGGNRRRRPEISRYSNFGGDPCPPSQTERCNTDPCVVNCSFQWSDWSPCSVQCGEGSRDRYPDISVQPAHGGEPCPHNQTDRCFLREGLKKIETNKYSTLTRESKHLYTF